jgi:hypothetical protein
MKIRTLVGLILQLMAIQFVLSIILGWGPTAIFANSFPFNQQTEPEHWRYRFFFGVAIVSGIFICAFAKNIAARMVGSDETISIGNLTIVDLYTIAFFVVAISFIVSSVVQVIYFAVENIKNAVDNSGRRVNLDFWTLLTTFAPPIIGFAILVNARSMATAYARKQQMISGDAAPEPPRAE